MGKKDRAFWESAVLNNSNFRRYYNRMVELSISMFKWTGLPDTVDPRFLELALFTDGQAVFFEDEVMGYLCLQVSINGGFNVYRIPVNRRAYAVNGYNKQLTIDDSVIIYNNYLHTATQSDIILFATRLYDIDRTIDVNVKAQKTPVLIQCDEGQKLTMNNLYKQYDGNEPFIMGNKALDVNGLKVLKTDAPFVGDKLYTLKMQIWNEALTHLGIYNTNTEKRERLNTDEIMLDQSECIANRYSRLEARRIACNQINNMFGLNVWCEYRQDVLKINEGDVSEDVDKEVDENE